MPSDSFDPSVVKVGDRETILRDITAKVETLCPIPCAKGLCSWPVGPCDVEEMNRGAVDAEDFVYMEMENCSALRLSDVQAVVRDLVGKIRRYCNAELRRKRRNLRDSLRRTMRAEGLHLSEVQLERAVDAALAPTGDEDDTETEQSWLPLEDDEVAALNGEEDAPAFDPDSWDPYEHMTPGSEGAPGD